MFDWTRLEQPVRVKVDLSEGLTERREHGKLVQGDKNANAIVAEIYQTAGAPYNLTGCTVTLNFVRPDGLAVPPITAEIGGENNNIAVATLTDTCYRYSGMYVASLKIKKGEPERTVVRINGDVISTKNNGIVDDEQLFPSPEELLAVLKEIENKTASAVAEVEAKGAETLASIPADYTALAGEVSQLSEEIDTLNQGGLVLKEDFIGEQVNDWLDSHPEATTTVQDRSLTIDKMVVGTLDYVTPEMFGAIGDGVADDTAAFIQAVNYPFVKCENAYNITGTVQLQNVKLAGGVFYDNTAAKLFDVKSNVTIENISVVGDGNFSDNSNYTIYVNGSNINVVGNRFTDISKGSAIFCIDSENIVISNNRIKNYSTDGIMLFMTCKFIKVIGNFVENCVVGRFGGNYPIGLSAYYGSVEDGRELNHDILCDGNTVINNKHWEGIDAHACYNVVVSNNSVYGCKVGIVITPTDSTRPYNCKIISNYVEGSEEVNVSGRNLTGGIAVIGNNHIVAGNTIVNAGIASNYGYGVYAVDVENVVLHGNILKNVMGTGFIVWEAKNISITNNNVNLITPLIEHPDYGTVPIYFDCSSNETEQVIVKNNICVSDTSAYEIVIATSFGSEEYPKNYAECKGNATENIVNDVITRDYLIIKDSLPYIGSVKIGKVGDFIFNNRKSAETPSFGWLCTADWVEHAGGVWTEVNF